MSGFLRTTQYASTSLRGSSPAMQQRFAGTGPWARVDPSGPVSIWRPTSMGLGVALGIFIVYTLGTMKHDHVEIPKYKYLHIRNKEFPWGPNGLFEKSHDSHH